MESDKTERLRKSIRILKRKAMRRLYEVLKKIDEYDLIAKQLSDLLLAEWSDAYEKAISEALYVINNQTSPTVTKAEIDGAINLMENILGKEYATIMQDDIREIVEETYTISQEAIQKISPTFNLVDYRAMDWLEETNIYWIGKHYDSQVVDRLKKAGYQVIEDGLARDEAGKVLKELFTDQFKKSNSYWEGLSNHIVTQSREFGAIEAYVKAEVTQYRIDAVLDDRTSDICRYLDGTIYEVSKAVEMRDRVMSAATPEASIKIKKWIPYDAKKDDPPDKDLPDFAFPPYHFNCRSRSVSV